MITSMIVLSQALVAAGIVISTSQVENFLTIVKEFSISPPSKEDLEVSFEDTNESCNIINEGYPLELENEKFLTCLSVDPKLINRLIALWRTINMTRKKKICSMGKIKKWTKATMITLNVGSKQLLKQGNIILF